MNIQDFFYAHPVFRYEEFLEWKNQHTNIQRSSIKTSLRYYVDIGRITQIKRKLYAVIPPNESIHSFSIDPYLIAGKASEDAIITYHSALELMGTAHSSFGQFNYTSKGKIKPFEFQGRWFQAIPTPKAIRTINQDTIYTEKVNRQGLDILVTNSSRTFVDVLDRIELSGGWEEIYHSINNIVIINVEEIIDYCLMLGNQCLNAKVGYFLELRKGPFAIADSKLKRLVDNKPNTPRYADKNSKEACALIKKWNLLLPESVINQTWEDPNADF